MDPAGRVLRINDAAASVLGRTRSELAGSDLTELAHPDDLEVALTELAQLQVDGRAARPMPADALRAWVADRSERGRS